ncbi:uncharacterized protein LOC111338050 [Stylophora pistillata]|uniref:SEA domain-containing protein n=1 Tax=Stylophora pistillata TaxID=50429 RepID=A0A2B4RTA3_STYPI|nr:uncharacterized protein LOC111338050 [Stylophora pistillata]PFX19548.1 hypothetical protein AWC38_SpisGene16028 [Stylophora pistillata]
MSHDELTKIVSASNMNITLFDEKELHLATTSILPETNTSILATLSASVTPQITSQTLDAPTAQTTSSMSTTPRLTKTRFSLETASASSLISPSFSEMLVTSSEANVTEESPAVDDSTESVPTERSPIKTQPTVPKDSVKFVVSMKVGSYNYTPEMANPESSVFKKVAREVENILYEELCVTENLLDCIAVEVFKLAKGSVIISYNIHMTSSTKYKQSDVNDVITESANGGQLGHLKVSDVEVKQREKVEEDEEGDNSSSRVFIYVLCGVGALLVIAVIITAISKYSSRRKNQVHEIPSNNDNSSR